jgi:hypothetical protein
MATILELAQPPQQKVFKLEPPLEANEQEFRRIYITPRIANKLRDEAPFWASQWKIDETPLEQFADLAAAFVAGKDLIFDYVSRHCINFRQGGCIMMKAYGS